MTRKREIPHVNNETERGTLGGVLIDPDQVDPVLAILRSSDFYDPRHATIFEAICALHAEGKPVSAALVDEWLRSRGRLADVGGSPYVRELVDTCENISLTMHYARIALDNALAREAQIIGARLVSGELHPDTAIAACEQLCQRRDVAHGEQIISFAKLMAKELPPLRYIVPTFLPEGLVILASKQKIGKSWLAYALAIAVGTGGRWLGQHVEAGDVLYLALEDGERRLQDRGRKLFTAGETWPDRLDLATKWDRLGTAGGERRIARWLKGHPAARLVIVDVFAKVKPPRSRNADPYAEDYAALEGLHALAQAYHVAIVVIHHTRKASAEDVYDELNGTSGLAGAADTLIVLQRPRDESEGVLHVTGREIENETSYAVRFSHETCAWQLAEDQQIDPLLSQESQDVLRVYQQAGKPLSPAQVAEALEIEKSDTKAHAKIRQRIGRLKDHGAITSAGFGRCEFVRAVNVGVQEPSHLSHSLREGATKPDGMRPEAPSWSVTPPAQPVTLDGKSVTPEASTVTLLAPSVTASGQPVTLPKSPESGNDADSGHANDASVTGVTLIHTQRRNGHASALTVGLAERVAQLNAQGIHGDAAIRRALAERGQLPERPEQEEPA